MRLGVFIMNNQYYQDISRSSSIRQAWLYFMYYWLIFAVGTFIGQFVPPAIHKTISIVLFAVIMLSLFTKAGRKHGALIANIYALAMGILSYTSFMYFLGVLGPVAFYQNIGLAVGSFFAFGAVGYFVVKDASNLAKILFPALIILIIASFIGIFIQMPMFQVMITVLGLAVFYGYTIYDFNRMARGNFSPREMGFNLFINLLNIILDILRLASILKD